MKKALTQRISTARAVWLLPLSGVLNALCLILPKIGFLQWISMVPALLWLFSRTEGEKRPRLRRLYGAGFFYFIAFYLTIFHWFFYLYPMEFAGVTPVEALVLVLICWIGLSLLQASLFSLIFPLFGLLCRTAPIRRFPWLIPFLFATQYTVAEWSQTLTWMGVPWARLPLGQIEMGFFVNSASLFGTYFLTFALVAVNGLVACALLCRGRVRFFVTAAASVLALSLITGGIGLAVNRTRRGEPILVAAVQGNVGSSEKWGFDSAFRTEKIYEEYTMKAAEAGASLVVFPETFLPSNVGEHTATGEYLMDLAQAPENGIIILCGGFYDGDEGQYNAMFAVYPDGTIDDTFYAKRHLVPFGEYVPWRPLIETLIPPLADMSMLAEDLLPGTDSAIIEIPGVARVGGLLCFDSIYETLTMQSVRDGADLLVLPTNDSWFKDSAAVYMHSAQARLRAIESGRWIIRAADTGISSIIDPDGKTHDELPPEVEGMSMATVYVNESRTLYSYIGNLLVYLMIAALVALPVAQIVLACRKSKKHSA